MPLQLLTPPAQEPVSLAEAKLHLRVDFSDDDALIGALITAARQAAETITGRQLITARWKYILDGFPAGCSGSGSTALAFSLPGHAILIPKPPVQSIQGIDYIDANASAQVMPSTDYVADLACEPARITPVFGKTWPHALPQIGSVSVTFDAGYGGAAAVPEGIKRWMLLRVGSLYQHREEVAAMSKGSIASLPFVDGLLDGFRMVTV